MINFTVNDIRSWSPCYDPTVHLPEDWCGSSVDILRHPGISHEDKLWVVCREYLLEEKALRLFAVWCARQIQHLVNDERVEKSISAAEQFTKGEVSLEELAAARATALKSILYPGEKVMRIESWNSARATTKIIARDAVREAALFGAAATAWEAADFSDTDETTWLFAGGVEWLPAWFIAGNAAWFAACDAQVAKLVEIFEATVS